MEDGEWSDFKDSVEVSRCVPLPFSTLLFVSPVTLVEVGGRRLGAIKNV